MSVGLGTCEALCALVLLDFTPGAMVADISSSDGSVRRSEQVRSGNIWARGGGKWVGE